MKCIGFSLSFCIKDILAGKVREDEVDYIISGTRCQAEEDWKRLFLQYSFIYWKDDISEAMNILKRFRLDNKIYQPRVDGYAAPSLINGHWVQL